eukprot:GHVT01059420.1.p1 GENE.GHVT01059420.1~~GHVT01059420.1.p1  ORF type:complete len:134 (+),score=1.08 GHVT01059420.1:73-474(+)
MCLTGKLRRSRAGSEREAGGKSPAGAPETIKRPKKMERRRGTPIGRQGFFIADAPSGAVMLFFPLSGQLGPDAPDVSNQLTGWASHSFEKMATGTSWGSPRRCAHPRPGPEEGRTHESRRGRFPRAGRGRAPK